MSAVPADFPGSDLVEAGLADLAVGNETVAAMLVTMAGSRLRAVGIEVPEVAVEHPSHRLYELLCETEGLGAHSRYNALVRRIVSFTRAAEHAPGG